MVSWGFAFRKGLVIFLWSIVWAIIGVVISSVIAGVAVLNILSNRTAANAFASLGIIIAGFIVGYLIYSIGVYATIVKVTMEGMAQQATMAEMQTRTMSSMGAPPPTQAMDSSLKCRACGATAPTGSTKCPNCGAML